MKRAGFLWVILLLLAWPLCAAESIDVDKVLSRDVTVQGTILLPEKEEYGVYRIAPVDFTQNPAESAQAVFGALFQDRSAAPDIHENEDEYGEGNVTVSNAAGEEAILGQNGSLSYYKADLIERYRYGSFRDFVLLGMADSLMPESLTGFSREDAEGLANLALASRLQGFEMSAQRIVPVSGEMLQILCREAGQPINGSFTSSDDHYIIQYVCTLEGLPVYSDAREEDQDIQRYTLANRLMSPWHGEVWVNREGIFFLAMNQMEISQIKTPRKVLPPLDALDALGAFLEDYILEFPTKITKGWLEYLPVPDKGSLWAGELRPFWCFQTSVYVDEEWSETGWESDRIFLVNGFSGKVRT